MVIPEMRDWMLKPGGRQPGGGQQEDLAGKGHRSSSSAQV